MFKRILVPIDGSHTADLGLDEAIKLARDQKAAICLFHVVDAETILRNAAVSGWMDIDGLLDRMRSEGAALLENGEAKARKHRVRAQTALVENTGGLVSDLIIAQASKWKADLIVLGTHGRRGLGRMVMGSDAEGVVRATKVPVLLVRSAAMRHGRKTARKRMSRRR